MTYVILIGTNSYNFTYRHDLCHVFVILPLTNGIRFNVLLSHVSFGRMHRRIRSLIEQSLRNLADETDIKDHSDTEIEAYLSHLDPASNLGSSFSYLFDHAKGKFIYLSKDVEKITGCNRVQMLNSKFSEVWDEVLPVNHGIILGELNLRCFATLRQQYSGRYDVRVFMDYSINKKNGESRRIMTAIKPLRWNETGGLVIAGGFFTDITHWKTDGQPLVTINCQGDILEKFEADTSMFKEGVSEFTQRELEILQMVSKGYSMEEVVKETGLSKATIYTHRRNILSKSELPSIHQLVRHLQTLGVVA